jgi:hypothetical protein
MAARRSALIALLATSSLACVPSDATTPEISLADRTPVVSASPLVGDGAIAFAISDLVDRFGYEPDEVILESIEAVEWPDSALGCRQADHEYDPGPSPGYRIVLTVGDQTYEYHGAAGDSEPFWCSSAD